MTKEVNEIAREQLVIGLTQQPLTTPPQSAQKPADAKHLEASSKLTVLARTYSHSIAKLRQVVHTHFIC
jgi:hypothetical protein